MLPVDDDETPLRGRACNCFDVFKCIDHGQSFYDLSGNVLNEHFSVSFAGEFDSFKVGGLDFSVVCDDAVMYAVYSVGHVIVRMSISAHLSTTSSPSSVRNPNSP